MIALFVLLMVLNLSHATFDPKVYPCEWLGNEKVWNSVELICENMRTTKQSAFTLRTYVSSSQSDSYDVLLTTYLTNGAQGTKQLQVSHQTKAPSSGTFSCGALGGTFSDDNLCGPWDTIKITIRNNNYISWASLNIHIYVAEAENYPIAFDTVETDARENGTFAFSSLTPMPALYKLYLMCSHTYKLLQTFNGLGTVTDKSNIDTGIIGQSACRYGLLQGDIYSIPGTYSFYGTGTAAYSREFHLRGEASPPEDSFGFPNANFNCTANCPLPITYNLAPTKEHRNGFVYLFENSIKLAALVRQEVPLGIGDVRVFIPDDMHGYGGLALCRSSKYSFQSSGFECGDGGIVLPLVFSGVKNAPCPHYKFGVEKCEQILHQYYDCYRKCNYQHCGEEDVAQCPVLKTTHAACMAALE